MAQDIKLAAACGVYCGECEFLGEKCQGCGNVLGRPFWAEQYGVEVCPVYDCSVTKHQLEHCGLCAEFPCDTFTSLRDPSMTDEQAEQSLRERQKDLTLRKEMGTETWLGEYR